MIKKLNLNIFKLYYILPFLLVSGPFLPDLLVSISSIFFLIYFMLYEKKLLKISWIFYFILFYFILILTSIFSINLFTSLKSSIPYLRFLIMVLSVYYLIEKKILKLKIFYLSLIGLIIILSADGLIQFITGENIVGFKSPITYRITSFFNEKAVLGGFTFKLIPLIFFLHMATDDFKFKKYLFILCLFFSILSIVISGDRSAFYLLIIFIILTCFMFFSKKNLLITVMVLSSILFLILKNDILKNRIIFMTYEGFFNTLDKFNPENINKKINIEEKKITNLHFYISDDHHHHMLTAINIFKEYPLLGSGPNTYRIICKDKRFFIKENSCTTHPHNFYLQLLAETGIFGFTIILLIFLKTSYYLIIKCPFLSTKKIDYFIYINLFLLLLPVLPNGNFFNNWLSIINFFPFGIYFYYLKNKAQFKFK
jgi:O-antigen ligase